MAGDGKTGLGGQTFFERCKRTFINRDNSAAHSAVQRVAVRMRMDLVIAESVYAVIFQNQPVLGELGQDTIRCRQPHTAFLTRKRMNLFRSQWGIGFLQNIKHRFPSSGLAKAALF